MNIVFWLIVVVIAVLMWFCFSSAFKSIGKFGLTLYNNIKDEITDEKERQELKENNKDENEDKR